MGTHSRAIVVHRWPPEDLAGAAGGVSDQDAKIPYHGEVVLFALPIWSMQTRIEEVAAMYLGVGDLRFPDVIGSWCIVEQMGTARLFAGESMNLSVLSRKRTRWLTEREPAIGP